MCSGKGEIYRPTEKKWVTFWLVGQDGDMVHHDKMETIDGIDACPACGARAEMEWVTGAPA